jgi:hypothetical protein
VPSLFLLDDLAYVSDMLVYDKCEDDRDIKDFLFQQCSEEQNIRSA